MFKMFWRNDKMLKQNLGWIVSIILLIILLVIGGWFADNYISNTNYQKGFADGQVNVVSSITQTGSIPYWDNSTGNLTIRTKSLQDICAGK